MIIHGRKEIYSVSLNNASYCRINGKWKVNTGGNELDWSKVNKNIETILEQKFIQELRKLKLKELNNVNQE
jgi:hypothetical protein